MGNNQKIVCHTQEELDAAYETLSQGNGGEIYLAAGITFELRAKDTGVRQSEASVTIKSLDINTPAQLETVRLREIENVTFENLELHMGNNSPEGAGGMISLTDCANVTFRDCKMSGAAEGAPGTPEGFETAANAALVRTSENIVFENNELSNFKHGLAFMDCRDVNISGNEMYGLQGDGIRIAGVEGMKIAGNHLHDFLGSSQDYNHADFIQLWGKNIAVNNKDITITENILDTGNGAQYQMIFGRNEDFEENGLYFENILIEGNVLYGSHYHSISIKETKDTIVKNNTVLYNSSTYAVNDDGSHSPTSMTPTIDIRGINSLVADNIAHRVMDDGTNAVLGTGGDRYDNFQDHFINLETGGIGDLRDIMLRPDSPLNGTAGSWLTWATDEAEALMAVADVTVSKFDHSQVTLSAEFSRSPDGYAIENGASFLWVFADGTTRSGAVVEHDFASAGSHDYTLIATLPDGSRDEITRSIEIASPKVFDLNFSDPAWDAVAGGADLSLQRGASVQDGWLQIGGRAHLALDRADEGQFALNGFNLGLTLDRDPGAEGTFLHLHQTLSATIDADGHIRFTFTTDEGTFTLISGEAIFADEQPHHVNFVYDAEAGSLALFVDDSLRDTIEAHGTTPAKAYWGLTIGHSWGKGISAQIKDVYFLNESITRDGKTPHDINDDDAPNFLGYLFWDSEGVEAIDLDYRLSGPGPWTPAGVNIRDNDLILTQQNDVFYNAGSFNLAFNLQLEDTKAHGTIAYLHKTLELTLNEAGQLVLRLNTSDGWQQIGSQPIEWDQESHSISIAFDAEKNSFQITLDGELVASGTHGGQTADVKHWGLQFGHPWEDSTIDALINYISVSSAAELSDENPDQDGGYDLSAHDLSGDALLAFDFESDHLADLSGGGAQLQVAQDVLIYSPEQGSQVLDVSPDDAAIVVSRDYDALYGQDEFLFAMDLKSDAENGRSVFGIHQAMRLDVVDDDLHFRMTTSEGQFSISTKDDVLADQGWHRVEIAYSDSRGQLQIRVDGELADFTLANGTTPERAHWGLTMGYQWGNGFDGQIDDFVFLADPGAQHFDLI